MKLIFAVLALLLSACATVTTTDPVTKIQTTTVDVSKSDIAVATKADLLAAAAYAEAHGYPARAAVRRAQATLLDAVNAQISACANAIRDSLPKGPANLAGVGPITSAEMAEEAVGNFSGIPASVKINCQPLPIPPLPVMPKP